MPTVAEDVAFSLRRPPPANPGRGAGGEVLDRFGLGGRRPSRLSPEAKRLLALAAVWSPNLVLVCDGHHSPTPGLGDQRDHRLAPQQVVMVTHHLDQLTDFDRVLVIDDGRLVADGPPLDALATYRQLID
jgi:biotin transport system ATP-binding protein